MQITVLDMILETSVIVLGFGIVSVLVGTLVALVKLVMKLFIRLRLSPLLVTLLSLSTCVTVRSICISSLLLGVIGMVKSFIVWISLRTFIIWCSCHIILFL